METKENCNVMDVIETVYQFSKDRQLQQPLFEVLENEINLLSSYLKLNVIEAVLPMHLPYILKPVIFLRFSIILA